MCCNKSYSVVSTATKSKNMLQLLVIPYDLSFHKNPSRVAVATVLPCQPYMYSVMWLHTAKPELPVRLALRTAPVKAACERRRRTCHISHQCQRIQHHQCAPSGTHVGHCETYPGAKWLHGIHVCGCACGCECNCGCTVYEGVCMWVCAHVYMCEYVCECAYVNVCECVRMTGWMCECVCVNNSTLIKSYVHV